MQSDAYTYVFYAVSAVVCLSAFGVVALRSVVHSAFALFFCLFSVAILFVLLSADFIAAIQLIVYVGGILILILFGILFTTELYKIDSNLKSVNLIVGLLIAVPLLLAGYLAIKSIPWKIAEGSYEPTAHELGNLLLSKYFLPFEIISVVLLLVMIGAIVLVRKEIRGIR